MPITTHTVTAKIADLLGAQYDQVRVTVRTNLGPGEAPIDTIDGRLLIGHGAIMVTNGTLTIPGLINPTSPGVNPTGIQYAIRIDYLDRVTRQAGSWDSGWLSVTADGNLATMVATQYAPPSWQTSFTQSMETLRDETVAARDQAKDISQIAVPDNVVKTLIQDPVSQTRSALTASIGAVAIGKAKDDHGGQVPRPIRVPTLVVDTNIPNRDHAHTLLWAKGSTAYALGEDLHIYKTTDAGVTFAPVSTPGTPPGGNVGLGYRGAFIKTTTGALLAVTPGATQSIYRSTDDGATWTSVYTFRAGNGPLGPQSFAEDSNGHLYIGEYHVLAGQTDLRVLRSTDGGATWSTFHSFIGPGGTGAKVRHVHSCIYDQYSDRVYILVGDAEADAGIYRVTADRTGVEPVLLNKQTLAHGGDVCRTIGIMWFPDYLVWGTDSSAVATIFRMHRSQIGAANPVIEPVYRMNSAAWWVIRAADDGSRWLVASSNENAESLDNAAHLYAVEDQGATVWELGAISPGGGAFPCLGPVGPAENHGDVLWMRGLNFEDATGKTRPFGARAQLARSTHALVPVAAAPPTPTVLAWETVSSGRLTVLSGQTSVFAGTAGPSGRRKLCIFDWNCIGIDNNSVVLEIYGTAEAAVLATLSAPEYSKRYTDRRAGAEYLLSMPVIDKVRFQLRATGAGSTIVCAHVTFGWALGA